MDPFTSTSKIVERLHKEYNRHPNFNALNKKAVEDFRSALNAVGDEEWKELVGDHCIVMIDRKGIHVKEYSHD